MSRDVLLVVTHELQGGNAVADAGACSLGEGLKSNASLSVLYLVSCTAYSFVC